MLLSCCSCKTFEGTSFNMGFNKYGSCFNVVSLPEPKAEVRPRLAHGGEWKAFVPQTPTGWLCNHKPCVPSPYPHQFTDSFPFLFLTCKYSCSDVSQGWQVQARLRCKCSPSCAKTSCGEHHVPPNRSAIISFFHLTRWQFFLERF